MAKRKVGTVDSRGKDRVQTVNTDPSETVQSDAHLADIQNILKSYGATGMEMLDETQMMFADVTSFTDLADAMNQARLAEVEFLKLPSKVREIFDHDVAVWLDSAHDEEKRDALVEAGFIKDTRSVSGRSGTDLGGAGAAEAAPAGETSPEGAE